MNFAGMGAPLMKKVMKRQNAMSLEELIDTRPRAGRQVRRLHPVHGHPRASRRRSSSTASSSPAWPPTWARPTKPTSTCSSSIRRGGPHEFDGHRSGKRQSREAGRHQHGHRRRGRARHGRRHLPAAGRRLRLSQGRGRRPAPTTTAPSWPGDARRHGRQRRARAPRQPEPLKADGKVKIHCCGTAGKIWGAGALEDFVDIVDDIVGIAEYITRCEEADVVQVF